MSDALTRDEFAELVLDQTGIELGERDLHRALDQLDGWDSVQLLGLLVALEKRVGRQLSLPDFLDAGDLGSLYEMVIR